MVTCGYTKDDHLIFSICNFYVLCRSVKCTYKCIWIYLYRSLCSCYNIVITHWKTDHDKKQNGFVHHHEPFYLRFTLDFKLNKFSSYMQNEIQCLFHEHPTVLLCCAEVSRFPHTSITHYISSFTLRWGRVHQSLPPPSHPNTQTC